MWCPWQVCQMRRDGTCLIDRSYRQTCALTPCDSLGETQGRASIESSVVFSRDLANTHEDHDSLEGSTQLLSYRAGAVVEKERLHDSALG
jgi:hypothetical protein